MELWKRNLIFCWFGMFVTGIGMSQIAPVLPLYVQQLGVTGGGAVEKFSGLAFGVTFIFAAVFSPIWGSAADKFGRKPMLLRASLGMSVVIALMGFAPNVWVLILLRMLQGTITGYGTACTTLIATQTDRNNAGFALGTLSTSNVAGSLLGPIIGGFIEDTVGLRPVFYITGGLVFIAFVLTLFFVKEEVVREPHGETRRVRSVREIWNDIPEKRLTVILSATLFFIALGLYSIEPIVTLYVGQISADATHLAIIAGVVFSITGLANIIAAPLLGRLSDKIGGHRVILFALLAAGIIYIPQAFVKNPWQLMALRFALGLTMGGLNPAVNTLIKKITPQSITGRIFGFTMAANYLGVFGGSIMGGQLAGSFGMTCVFFVTAAIMLLNAGIVFFGVYKKMERP